MSPLIFNLENFNLFKQAWTNSAPDQHWARDDHQRCTQDLFFSFSNHVLQICPVTSPQNVTGFRSNYYTSYRQVR